MCSYNLVNSSWACQNSKVLNGLLKHELGFQGQVLRYVDSKMPGFLPLTMFSIPVTGKPSTQESDQLLQV